MPALWVRIPARLDPQAAKDAWLREAAVAGAAIWRALGEAIKQHDGVCATFQAAVREEARRLGKTDRVCKELLGTRRANGNDVLIMGEGSE